MIESMARGKGYPRGRPRKGFNLEQYLAEQDVEDRKIEEKLRSMLQARRIVDGLVRARCPRCDSNVIEAAEPGLARDGSVIANGVDHELTCVCCGETWTVRGGPSG